jgi:hypothetical protein
MSSLTPPGHLIRVCYVAIVAARGSGAATMLDKCQQQVLLWTWRGSLNRPRHVAGT